MNLTIKSPVVQIVCSVLLLTGCNSRNEQAPIADQPIDNTSPVQEPQAEEKESESQADAVYEVNASALLESRLPEDQLTAGWIRLFDGSTLVGLQAVGEADWQLENGCVVAESGGQGLLCTTTRWQDYELSLEFKADENTNSGLFLRTPLSPTDPASDCYELNIAPKDNPFPTGSLVKRHQSDATFLDSFDYSTWHRFDVTVEGGKLTALLDGKEVLNYEDPSPLPRGLIGLQHNEGAITFRDIRIRPLGMQSLLEGELESTWNRYPDLEGDFELTSDGMHVTGGRGQLETKAQYGDFTLTAEVRTGAADLNSGIFFRCIPGDQMMGYECQISNALKADDPLFPADCGTGGFFRRQDARIVAAQDQEWFSMTLKADGSLMAAWVNGIQVSEWRDDRAAHENPRKGLRTDPGTIMLQAHDPTTDIMFRRIAIVAEDASGGSE